MIPRNRWFNVYLHQFLRSDDPRACHDHPWWNVSVLLNGSYIEWVQRFVHPDAPLEYHLRRPFRPVFRGARTAHRVELPHRVTQMPNVVIVGDLHYNRVPLRQVVHPPRPVWSLFVTGPRVRDWGFWCKRNSHGAWVMIPWQEFTTPTPGGNKIGPGCDG